MSTKVIWYELGCICTYLCYRSCWLSRMSDIVIILIAPKYCLHIRIWMPDFYYIDLYFDPEEKSMREIVDGCVYSMICAGATFEKIFLASSTNKQQVSIGEHVQIQPQEFGVLAEAYLEEYADENNFFFSFPPHGRIMFKYDFVLDQYMMDEITEEENETKSSANDIGMTFLYSVSEHGGKRVKVSMSLWEEYLLTHGSDEVHRMNIDKLTTLISSLNQNAEPYFGAMNSELHLNTDKSLDLLWEGKLPEGNEFVFVGKQMVHMLDMDEVKARGLRVTTMQNGAVMLELTDKWPV